MDINEKISEIIYNDLCYMYCDNCRYNIEIEPSEEDDYYPCDNCHRKYNGWAISKAEANSITNKIIKLFEDNKNDK